MIITMHFWIALQDKILHYCQQRKGGCNLICFVTPNFMMSRSHLNAGAEMTISIEIGKSGENEASHSSICPSQPFAMLRDDHLRAGDHDEPDPLLLLHDGERAAWQVL